MVIVTIVYLHRVTLKLNVIFVHEKVDVVHA